MIDNTHTYKRQLDEKQPVGEGLTATVITVRSPLSKWSKPYIDQVGRVRWVSPRVNPASGNFMTILEFTADQGVPFRFSQFESDELTGIDLAELSLKVHAPPEEEEE